MESHHPPSSQGYIVAGGGVSSPAWILPADGELAKTGKHHIFPGFEAGLDVLQDGFNELSGSGLGKAALGVDAVADVVFGQGHDGLLTQGGESDSLLGMCLQIYPPPDGCNKSLQLGFCQLHKEMKILVGDEYFSDGFDEFLFAHGISE
jgi:hypothetical protein